MAAPGAFSQSDVGQDQRVFFEGIYKLYQNEADFWSQIKQETEEVPTNYKGRQITVELSANPSLATSSLDGGNFATPGSPVLGQLLVTYCWLNSGLEETYGARLNNNKETTSDVMDYILKSSAKQFSQWLNYYASNGNGTSRLATVSANYDGGAPTVATCNGDTDTIGATYLVKGQKGWFYDPTGTTKRVAGNANIQTVATVNGTFFTVDSSVPTSVVVGDIFVPETGAGITVAPKGVPYIVNDNGDYFNADRDTVEQWRSTVVYEDGGMSALGLYTTFAQTQQRSGEAGRKYSTKGMKMVTNITQQCAYQNLTLATPQNHVFMTTNAGRPPADVGGDNLQFTWWGCPIDWMYQFNGTDVYFLYMDLFKIAMLKNVGQLLDMPAGDWIQALSGSDSIYRAAVQRWMDAAYDMYSRQPFKMGRYATLSINDLPTQKGG